LPLSPGRARFYLETFYKAGISEIEKYHFSHLPRISTTSKVKLLFSNDVKAQIDGYDSTCAFERFIPSAFNDWHHLARAQYLEATTLLSGYLLSSQGDRVTAAHSVEGRFPFLDYRVVELGARIPPWHKILGLKEKIVLKKAMKAELPSEITERVKQPYMAPDSNSFVQPDSPDYVEEMLSDASLRKAGVFDPVNAAKMKEKCTRLSHAHMSFKDNMSFIGILSTQLLVDLYIENFQPAPGAGKGSFKIWHDYSDNN
jgi:asparagine synthase (glutamine-hydrolysing)